MDIAAESLAKHAEWRGKLAFDPKMDIATRHDLAVAYTPGVAEPCKVIAENPEAQQPWDVKGYKLPGGAPTSPAVAANLPAFPAILRKQIKGAPMPAPKAILSAAVEGAQVDIDNALIIEARYFTELVTGQVAKNMIKAMFFDLAAISKGASRPQGYPQSRPTKVGVVGAGMMGAAIAMVSSADNGKMASPAISTKGRKA